MAIKKERERERRKGGELGNAMRNLPAPIQGEIQKKVEMENKGKSTPVYSKLDEKEEIIAKF